MSSGEQEMIEQLLVAGGWVDSSASGETFGVTTPATGGMLSTLPDAGREETQ